MTKNFCVSSTKQKKNAHKGELNDKKWFTLDLCLNSDCKIKKHKNYNRIECTFIFWDVCLGVFLLQVYFKYKYASITIFTVNNLNDYKIFLNNKKMQYNLKIFFYIAK